MIYLEIITSIFLVFVMGYMSAIETAYLAVNEKKIELDSLKNDNKKLKRLKEILRNPSSFISSIKSGIAFCSLWLGALIVEIIPMPIFKNIDFDMQPTAYIVKYFLVLITIILLSYFIYVIVDLTPKAIAIKKKEKIVLRTVDFVYVFSKIFKPVTKFMRVTEALVMRVYNVDRKEKISYKDSEIKEAIEVGQDLGVISKNESLVISNFIRLDEMTAENIMIDIEKVAMVDISWSKDDIKKKMLDSGYTRLPVYDKDIRNVVGILNVKNVLRSMLAKEKLPTARHIKPCMFISPGKRLDLLFNEMKNHKEHMAVVVKEKDIAVGIVAMEDIIEQIVGNIEDDFEKYKGVE